ncbi:MAG: bifunctional 3,4-dihydroxy-2-butanone 4-phosphate synthase/GTP cyclohydrolase II [Epsilonproteobacteria bacterium]|nr:bifunctional 3,4-dihydroxy-2-butanone 4-phosphate synthase/GTP cyclohydrolase II [Campylobacterota bacterium]
MSKDRVKRAIEDIKQGKMVLMVDDEDRENEGDLVYAATFSTPQKVNFMASHAKGLICVALSKKISDELDLVPMVVNNNSQHETAFTVTVDAATCTTGISAYERDMTIKILADSMSKPSDLVRPGHIFPLIAKKGGTLVRTGHTEGSVDLCKLAGLNSVAVICEVMKEDGTMARRDDLDLFCKENEINMIYISDIVEYRLQHESLVREISSLNTSFLGADARRVDMVDHEGNHHTIYEFGKLQKTSIVKFHNILWDDELFASREKFEGMIKAIDYLKKNGGVLVFIGNENSFSKEIREFGVGAQILNKLGIENIKLISSIKGSEFVGLSGFGLKIVENIEL